MTFPLLKLPFLAYEQVIINFEVADLIDFSLLSTRCHRNVQSIRFPFTGIDVRLGSSCNSLEFYKGSQTIAQWYFKKKRWSRLSDTENGWRQLGGTRVRIQKSPDWHSTRKPDKNMKAAFDYVQSLFRLPIISYHILSTDHNLFPQFLSITRCDELIMDLSHKIGVDELKYVLDTVEVSKRLTLHLQENYVFEYGFVRFSMDKLYINPAFWITKETFLAMDCTEIELHGNMTLPIRKFVSQWLSSRNTRFEWLRISWNMERINWNEAFKTMKWNPKTRGRNFKINEFNRVDCHDGIDILRDDGLLATVAQKYGAIYFVVWHKRFQPEADHLKLDHWIMMNHQF
uniref:FBA_2 domain-containing protein n=1 Tax=Caenorhabditis tropicalis TaxID=1561998 RepID=A0A1I7TKY5_9PELO